MASIAVLVLHGSRARGDGGPDSDWDFGVLPAPGTSSDLAALGSVLVALLGTDRVDVVDLQVASALLRFRVARDGVVLLERDTGAFLRFREEAIAFWCDTGPVVPAAQESVLARLG